jgi:MFS family permease
MSSRSDFKELFGNKEFNAFLCMRVCLTLALQIQAVVVGWQIYKLTEDPLSLGLIGLAEAIPALSIALYAGHVADTQSKRKILIYALGFLWLCSLGLLLATMDEFVLFFGATISVRAMYTFIFLSGIARGFIGPTGFAFLAQMVKREWLTRASTLNSTAWQLAAIAGPALGGILYAMIEITPTFMVVIFFMTLAWCTLFFIKPKPVLLQSGTEKISVRLKEGIRFVFKHKVILSALSLDLFAVLFGGAVALLPVFAHEVLHVGPQGLGLLRAAPSLGASITMIWLSVNSHINKPGVVLLCCVGAFGACMIGFALSTSFYLSLLLLFLSGAFDSVSVVIRGNILQLQTPDEMRGRVSAVNTMFIGSSNEIGAFESGVAARLLGTVPSVVFGGSITLLIVGFTTIKAKALRRFSY